MPASRFYTDENQINHDNTTGRTYIGKKCVFPVFPFVPSTNPDRARLPEYPILQHITVIYHRRVLSIADSAKNAALLNRFDRPVSEERLWVCDPFLAVVAVVMTARANAGRLFSIDYLFTFLIS